MDRGSNIGRGGFSPKKRLSPEKGTASGKSVEKTREKTQKRAYRIMTDSAKKPAGARLDWTKFSQGKFAAAKAKQFLERTRSYGMQRKIKGVDVNLAEESKNLRFFYELEFEEAKNIFKNEIANFDKLSDKEQFIVAKSLHQIRRQLGATYKGLTPGASLDKIFERNIEVYGDKYGPTMEFFLKNPDPKKRKSLKQIVDFALSPGGDRPPRSEAEAKMNLAIEDSFCAGAGETLVSCGMKSGYTIDALKTMMESKDDVSLRGLVEKTFGSSTSGLGGRLLGKFDGHKALGMGLNIITRRRGGGGLRSL